MPEVEYVTTMTLAPERVWEFVRDMNNWAPFLTGYQKHEIESETDSIWTLKGDVGVLSRTVRLKAHVTEWNGPERVSFTLVGLDEVVEGGGTLTIGKPAAATAATGAAIEKAKPKKASLWRRFVDGFFRMMFRWVNGKGPQRLTPAPGAGAPESQLTFRLRMDAGGPAGPLVNAMLAPALKPAAEDLANKIAAHLEALPRT
ncbi:MAG TPA: SRPBCC family protein [Polyangia bacterium]|jgi:carbon monoxide dehydrogenase subunit G|nr:SRPBCC family protein [Polyangia bacterium]